MASTDHAMGMMDAAYFTGRKEILEWVNDTLALGCVKIEQTCTGAIACQLIDAHFPGQLPMSKVNWEARNDYEYFNNYKVLQAAFNKLNIEKKPDVDKLSRGKYQDNLEFMQWFKGFLDRHAVAEGYDPVAARSRGKGASKVERVFGKAGTKVTTVKPRKCGVRVSDASRTSSSGSMQETATANPLEKENTLPASHAQRPPRGSSISSYSSSSAKPRLSSSSEVDADTIRDLQGKVASLEATQGELTLHTEGLEKERDFYFDKLREIEVLLQVNEEAEEAATDGSNKNPLASSIFKILYQTTDDFIAVEEDGGGGGGGGEGESFASAE